MNEQLLQYIWKFRLYSSIELYTTCFKKIHPIHQGIHNVDQGPDFLHAKIKIDDSVWAGHVELHVKSSDWELHKHNEDEHYSNVILHVVWYNDKELNLPFPTLEIQPHVPKILLRKYIKWMNETSFIACQNSIPSVNSIILSKCKERMLFERLQLKSQQVADFINATKGDWEEVCWWIFAKSFGGKVNGDDFEKIARSIPLKILLKNKHSLQTIESIIFGQSGLLSKDFKDPYPLRLQQEYEFYRIKYKLKAPKIRLKFLRMRPSNFPTIKLAQLSSFIFNRDGLLSIIKKSAYAEVNCFAEFPISVSEYWNHHYCFEDQAVSNVKKFGKSSHNNLFINCVAVVLYAWGYFYNDEQKKNQAINILYKLKAENNIIVNSFKKLNVSIDNAFDSQSIIHLYKTYCQPKRCLECTIGYTLFKKELFP